MFKKYSHWIGKWQYMMKQQMFLNVSVMTCFKGRRTTSQCHWYVLCLGISHWFSHQLEQSNICVVGREFCLLLHWGDNSVNYNCTCDRNITVKSFFWQTVDISKQPGLLQFYMALEAVTLLLTSFAASAIDSHSSHPHLVPLFLL